MKKNLSVIVLMLVAMFVSSSVTTSKAQSINLFNGKDLSNWNFVVDKNAAPSNEVYSVKDKLIHITGTLGYMYTKESYSNFVLDVEWRWPNTGNSNSGIFLYLANTESPFPTAIECQLHNGDAGDFVLLNKSDLKEFSVRPGEKRPFFPVVKKTNESSEHATGEWNRAKIYCQDGVITVFINGIYQNTGTCQVKEGPIALQSEGSAVEFRKVVLTKK